MNLFVDTSVWSLALRRSSPAEIPDVRRLMNALEAGDLVISTGLVLQELLQGSQGRGTATSSWNAFPHCRS